MIGKPLLKAITEKGAPQLGRPPLPKSRGGAAPQIGAPPPFISTWEKTVGRGGKNTEKSGKGLLLSKNSPFNSIPIIGQIF